MTVALPGCRVGVLGAQAQDGRDRHDAPLQRAPTGGPVSGELSSPVSLEASVGLDGGGLANDDGG